MTIRNRKAGLAVAALVLTLAVMPRPTADIRLITHDPSDPAPHRMQAAVDLGLIGISVLYTWTVDRLR